ncbi:MAG: hypothetical protein WC553_00885 [Patescibacteria group bacterium]
MASKRSVYRSIYRHEFHKLCSKAYEYLCELHPNAVTFDPPTFGEYDGYGQRGDRIWFNGNAYIGGITPKRYLCVAELVFDSKGRLLHIDSAEYSLLPHNAYFDFWISKGLFETPGELEDPDLFRRDRPPPRWLTQKQG